MIEGYMAQHAEDVYRECKLAIEDTIGALVGAGTIDGDTAAVLDQAFRAAIVSANSLGRNGYTIDRLTGVLSYTGYMDLQDGEPIPTN